MAAGLNHPPTPALERLAAAVEGTAAEGIRAHLATCGPCAARMSDVLAEREAFLVLHPPGGRTAGIIARERRRTWLLGTGVVGVAAVAAVVIGLVTASPAGDEHGARIAKRAVAQDRVTAKGGGDPVVVATVRRAGTASRLEPASTVRAGDRLQFEINPGSFAWLGVYELTERGPTRITELFPAIVGALPDEFTVEPGTADERVAFVFAPARLQADQIPACLARPSAACHVVEVRLVKEILPIAPGPNVGSDR